MTVLTRLRRIIDRFRRDDDGQGLAEYALILALIAIVAIVALIFLGSQISDKLSVIGSTARLGRAVDPARRTGHPTARRTTVRRAVSCPSRARPVRVGPATSPDRTLQASLHRAWISCRFLLMVLALWYSRAAFGAVLEWCHLSHQLSGRTNLKRSNRLVLLVGVFLAIVAFVGILLLVAGHQRRQPADAAPTTGPVVVATADIPLSARDPGRPGRRPRRSPDRRSRRAPSRTSRRSSARSSASRSRPAPRSPPTTLSGGDAGTIIDIDVPAGLRCDRGPGRPGHRRRHGHQDRRLRRHGRRPHRRQVPGRHASTRPTTRSRS